MGVADLVNKKNNKKKGGLLSGIKDVAGKVGGGALELLGAPQQIVFGLGAGLGDALEGDFKSAGHGLTHALKETATLGQSRDNWDFAQAVGSTDKATGKRLQAKLPTGLNTLATFLVDPTLVTAVGKGAQATKGLAGIARTTGQSLDDVTELAAKVGGKKMVADAGKSALTKALADDVLANSRKTRKLATTKGVKAATEYAEKQARKTVKAVEKRGAGGVSVGIPGTTARKVIVSDAKLNAAKGAIGATRAGKGASALADSVKASKGAQFARKTFDPIAELSDRVGRETASAVRRLGSNRMARQEAAMDNILAELKSAVLTSSREAGRALTAEDDKLVQFALQGGKKAADEVAEQAPHLQPLLQATKRMRASTEGRQILAGVLDPKKIHDSESYLRRIRTGESLEQLGDDSSVINRIASQVGGGLSGSLAQKAAKARKFLPDMPDSKVNELIARVQAGEKAEDLIELEEFSQYIGASQKAKAKAQLDRTLESIQSQPLTSKSAAEFQAEAKDFFKKADELIQQAQEAGEEFVTIGGNTYLTPQSQQQWTDLYDFINKLKTGQNLDPEYLSGAIGSAMWDAQKAHLPTDVHNAIMHLTQSGSQASKQKSYDLVTNFVKANGPEYQAYKKALKENLKKAGFGDEFYVFRGFKQSNMPGEFTNTSLIFHTAKAFAEYGTLARIYKVKLDDIAFSMAGHYSNELEMQFFTKDLHQLHPDELKQFRTKKKTKIQNTKMSKVEAEVAKAKAEDLKALGEQANVQAGQLLQMGAVTEKQMKDQLAAAMKLFEDHADDAGLRKALAGQIDFIAQKLKPGTKLYEESAMASIIARENEAARAIEAANYVNDLRAITDEAGQRILYSTAELRAAKQKPPAGWKKFELPVLGEFHAPEELVHEMQRVVKFMTDDKTIEELNGFMKKWEQFWKTHATVGLLGALPFGTRNARSNLYLMMAGGITPDKALRQMKEAHAFQRKISKLINGEKHAAEIAEKGLDHVLMNNLDPHDYKLYREAQNRGILTQGFFDFDFEDDLMDKVKQLGVGKADKKRTVKSTIKDVASPKGAVAQKGRKFNSHIEHNARLAAFFHFLDEGDTPAEAAMKVKQYLFDYSDLSRVEQRVLKRIVPFYTFMRKNLPLQVKTLLTEPARIAVPEKISLAMTEPLPEGSPDYMEDQGSRVVRDWVPLLGGRVTTPDRPFYGAVQTLSPLGLAAQGRGVEAARATANIASGPQLNLLKYMIEQGTKKDSFTGGNIPPGAATAIQRLLVNQVPSLGRLPRVELPGNVSPTRAVTGKSPKPTAEEILKLLTGVRAAKS